MSAAGAAAGIAPSSVVPISAELLVVVSLLAARLLLLSSMALHEEVQASLLPPSTDA